MRVSRSSQGGKGPRVTADVPSEPGHGMGLVRRGPDPIRRLAAAHPDAAVEADDPAVVAALRGDLGARARIVPQAFDDDIASAIEELHEPVVDLPSGARLSFHPTPALTAIDVDTAAATGRDTAKLNRALIPDLARQIRLRALAGAILVDFAGMAIKRRGGLAPDLVRALRDDPEGPRLIGFTGLGLAEILRPRVRPPLHELLTGPRAAGLAALRAMARAVAADPARRPDLRAHPAVIAALRDDPGALTELAARIGRAAALRADPAMAWCAWTIEDPHG